MIKFNIVKCHGSANDFILVDEIEQKLFDDDRQRSEFAQKLCDRIKGIGADGILFVQESNDADAKMRIFNADGSEAAMCGNGLRCVARFLSEKFERSQFLVETMFTIHNVSKVSSIYQDMPTYSVEIKPISIETASLKMQSVENSVINQIISEIDDELKFSAIAVPNPHLITFVLGAKDFEKQEGIATFLNEKKTIFLDGVNVSFVRELAENRLFVKTFERGVGFTNACGTAMSATSYVYHLINKGINNNVVSVYNPGAMVQCSVSEHSIDLIGNATFEFIAEMSLSHENNSYEIVKNEIFSNEIEQFRLFEEDCKKEMREFI